MFSEIIEHINNNGDFYSLLSTLLMVLLTAIYVVLTFKLLSENKKAREDQTRPFIYIDFEVKNLLIYLKIKNAGNSPAKKIEINTAPNLETVPNKLDYLPPEREVHYRLNLIVANNPDSNISDNYNINVKYQDFADKLYSNDYKIDATTYLDMASHNNNELSNIERYLKDINNAMGSGNSSIKSSLKNISSKLK